MDVYRAVIRSFPPLTHRSPCKLPKIFERNHATAHSAYALLNELALGLGALESSISVMPSRDARRD
jgi:hypothetical protein